MSETLFPMPDPQDSLEAVRARYERACQEWHANNADPDNVLLREMQAAERELRAMERAVWQKLWRV